MRRRDAVLTLVLGTVPLAAGAQRTERMRRIGVLMSPSQTNPSARLDVAGLLEGLQEKGWVEGKNLQIDYRWADGDADRARGYAAELANMAADLIFASGTVSLNHYPAVCAVTGERGDSIAIRLPRNVRGFAPHVKGEIRFGVTPSSAIAALVLAAAPEL